MKRLNVKAKRNQPFLVCFHHASRKDSLSLSIGQLSIDLKTIKI